MSERKFNYKAYGDRVYFYYGENLIFQNSKSMPFIVLKKQKKGIETFTSLFTSKINESDECFDIVFSGKDDSVNLNIKEENNILIFQLTGGDYDEICFTLYKKSEEKVYGLPTYKTKKIKQNFIEKLLRKKPIEILPEKKLSFYLLEKYFFENINITEYSYEITDNIYINSKTKNPKFRIIFSKNIYSAINTEGKDNENIKKYPLGVCFLRSNKVDIKKIIAFEKENKIKIKGIIINQREFNLSNIKPEIVKCEKNGYEIMYVVNKYIGKNFARKYFLEEEYTDLKNGFYKIDLSQKDTVRKYLIIIRKYLDEGISGLYFDGDFTKSEMAEIQLGMKKVLKEYIGTAIFHNTLTENNNDFGYYIIKNKFIIERFSKLSSYYLYSGEYLIGKEEKNFTKSKNFSINIINI